MSDSGERSFVTTWGTISYEKVGTKGKSNGKLNPDVLLIHGNSMCKKIWRHILQDEEFIKSHRVIAVDLLGHGQSSNASTPQEAYTMGGYAQTLEELVRSFRDEPVEELIILGRLLFGKLIDLANATLKDGPSVVISGWRCFKTLGRLPPRKGRSTSVVVSTSNAVPA
jgi:uncharacterized protein YcbK (DUF882 family)